MGATQSVNKRKGVRALLEIALQRMLDTGDYGRCECADYSTPTEPYFCAACEARAALQAARPVTG